MGVVCSSDVLHETELISSNIYVRFCWSPTLFAIGGITFEVKASRDAQIGLFSNSADLKPFIEITLGADNNRTITTQLVSIYGNSSRSCDVPYLLDEDDFRGFWVIWMGGGIIVGWGDDVGQNEAIRLPVEGEISANAIKVQTPACRGIWKNGRLLTRKSLRQRFPYLMMLPTPLQTAEAPLNTETANVNPQLDYFSVNAAMDPYFFPFPGGNIHTDYVSHVKEIQNDSPLPHENAVDPAPKSCLIDDPDAEPSILTNEDIEQPHDSPSKCKMCLNSALENSESVVSCCCNHGSRSPAVCQDNQSGSEDENQSDPRNCLDVQSECTKYSPNYISEDSHDVIEDIIDDVMENSESHETGIL